MQGLALRYARLMAVAGISLLASLASPAAQAAMIDEIRLAEKLVQDAILKLDGARPGQARAALLEDALEGIGILDRLAAPPLASPAASQALDEFGRQAITLDILRLSLVEALSTEIGASPDGLRRDLEAKALVEAIADPAYRSAGWSQLARTHQQAGHRPEAERLAARALEDARKIDRKPTRDGALRAAILVFPPAEPLDGLVEAATNAMTTASARAEILRLRSIATLTAERKLSSDEIWEIGRLALSRQSHADALQAAQAMDRDDDRRADILEQVLAATLGSSEEALGVEAAKSMSRDRDQNRALRRIIDERIKRERPLRAATLLPLMLTDNARTDAEIAIAKALADLGYRKAAVDMLTALNVSPVDDPDSAAELAAALAGFSLYDKAEALAGSIADRKERSFAYARISRSLSEDALLEKAEALLENVSQKNDIALAQAALAKALIKTGNVERAGAILKAMPEGDSRDGLLEAFVRNSAGAGRLDEARATLAGLSTPEARGRALVALALALHLKDRDAAKAALSEAHDLLKDQKTQKALADVAVAYAKIGDLQRADLILGDISDDRLRDTTARRIADTLIRKGDLKDAETRLPGLSEPARSAVRADLALADFRVDGRVERLVSSVRDLPYRLRVSTFRQMAETRARTLDRKGWLSNPNTDPLTLERHTDETQRADFLVGQHIIHAPAPSGRTAAGLVMPDIFSLGIADMRARVPARRTGAAHLALLGFSPFSPAAFRIAGDAAPETKQDHVSGQTTWPDYIAVTEGVVTLGDILRDLPEAKARGLLMDRGDILHVRAPIIVLPAATLVLSGAEFSQYRLGVQSGAFLAVAGKLVVQDAEVIGHDEQANAPATATDADGAEFRPYITGWGGSDFQIAGSRFAMLGYDSGKSYGLTQSSGTAIPSLHALADSRPTGALIDNSFENMRYGYYGAEAADVRLIGNEYRDNVIHGIDLNDRSQRVLVALNTAYGSQKKHGIIVSRENDESFIVGNLAVWNTGSGLMLDRSSRRNVIYANSSLGNGADGLTLYESSCNIAIANDFSSNQRAGIKVRNSADIGVYDNRIHNNRSNGAYIYASELHRSADGRLRPLDPPPHQPVASAVISGNNFAANGNAINVDGAAETILDANSFRDQRNYIYGGDLRPLSPYLLQIGEKSPVLVGMACQPQRPREQCTFGDLLHQARSDVICTGMSPARPSGTEGKVENNG